MSNDKKEVLHRIKTAFNTEINIPNNIRLPHDIEFSITGNEVEMSLLGDAITRNMQEDKAAFEGWALVLKRWGRFEKVIMKWDRPVFAPDSSGAAHYQRFLFRVKSFAADFKAWFSISPDWMKYLDELKIDDSNFYYLSAPYNERDNADQRGKEAILEYHYALGDWSEALKAKTNAEYLNRQLPVGVFHPPVSNKTKILPKNKSAIDIWGISKSNELLLFELKADGNNKIGIISELYCYSCIMRRVRSGQFKHEKYKIPYLDRIASTDKIRAYLFAPGFHPLIDPKLLDEVNKHMAPDVEFQFLRFPAGGGVAF